MQITTNLAKMIPPHWQKHAPLQQQATLPLHRAAKLMARYSPDQKETIREPQVVSPEGYSSPHEWQ
jgi:hypothetical protein